MGLTYYCMATCDNCSTTSELVEDSTDDGAMLELESDGWSIVDQLLLCPRCVADEMEGRAEDLRERNV